MKTKLLNIFLLIGVLCFMVGAVTMLLGHLGTLEQYALPVIGLMPIGAGSSSKQRAK